jgi:hypothetical protein
MAFSSFLVFPPYKKVPDGSSTSRENLYKIPRQMYFCPPAEDEKDRLSSRTTPSYRSGLDCLIPVWEAAFAYDNFPVHYWR